MQVKIMRGMPGSGKTTYAKKNYPGAVYCSADDYHTGTDGIYRFVPANTPRAHQACLRKFLDAVRDGCELVVVDNTNTQAWEIATYYRLAELFDYEVEIVHARCPLEVCLQRQTHNVPILTMFRMWQALSVSLPPHWREVDVE